MKTIAFLFHPNCFFTINKDKYDLTFADDEYINNCSLNAIILGKQVQSRHLFCTFTCYVEPHNIEIKYLPYWPNFRPCVHYFDVRDDICIATGGFLHGDIVENFYAKYIVIGVKVDENNQPKLWFQRMGRRNAELLSDYKIQHLKVIGCIPIQSYGNMNFYVLNSFLNPI